MLKRLFNWLRTFDERAERRGHLKAQREAEQRAQDARVKADGQVLNMMVEYYNEMAVLAEREAAFHLQRAQVASTESAIAERRASLVVLP